MRSAIFRRMHITHRVLVPIAAALLSCEMPQAEPLGGAPTASVQSALNKSGTRIQVRVITTTYTTSDGASYDMPSIMPQMFDTKFNVPCFPQTAEDGILRCIPTTGATAGPYYSDSACNSLMVQATGCPASVPTFAIQLIPSTGGTCPTNAAKVFRVGSALPAGRWHMKSGTSCIDVGPMPAGYSFYALGSAMAANEFVQASTSTRSDIAP
jgi:hypothetical protein